MHLRSTYVPDLQQIRSIWPMHYHYEYSSSSTAVVQYHKAQLDAAPLRDPLHAIYDNVRIMYTAVQNHFAGTFQATKYIKQ